MDELSYPRQMKIMNPKKYKYFKRNTKVYFYGKAKYSAYRMSPASQSVQQKE